VSDHAHSASGAADGHAPPPASSAVSVGVKLLVVGGAVLSIMQGAFVAASSGFGRVWPAADSATIQLPPAHLTEGRGASLGVQRYADAERSDFGGKDARWTTVDLVDTAVPAELD
jgi:hypothetical protein